uniref:HMG box domain-containing protein n=1 Tax=Entomoneis paludosa TaxID=265537 RepID=A0A7S2YNY4_9STRA|mmetsp:Transcript_40924/g.85220  ORF Transcript_40924/g.85220 Transcript_40924/m.85220 type:complete len:410 (+) Transcript_40924:249-1478(+)
MDQSALFNLNAGGAAYSNAGAPADGVPSSSSNSNNPLEPNSLMGGNFNSSAAAGMMDPSMMSGVGGFEQGNSSLLQQYLMQQQQQQQQQSSSFNSNNLGSFSNNLGAGSQMNDMMLGPSQGFDNNFGALNTMNSMNGLSSMMNSNSGMNNSMNGLSNSLNGLGNSMNGLSNSMNGFNNPSANGLNNMGNWSAPSMAPSSASDLSLSLSNQHHLQGGANATFGVNNQVAMAAAASAMPLAAPGKPDAFAQQGLLGPWSERAAGLLGSMVCKDPADGSGGKGKRSRRRQPKDKPKRPLSAYNIFFKEERARLLEKTASKTDEQKKEMLTANGKIAFQSLAKIIGGKWQDMKPEDVEYYKEKAGKDMIRYKKEMEAYKKKEAAKQNGEDQDGVQGEDGDDASNNSNKRQKFQ